MADIVFVAIALAFFGLASLYVSACDRIIGRETPPTGGIGGPDRARRWCRPADAAVSA